LYAPHRFLLGKLVRYLKMDLRHLGAPTDSVRASKSIFLWGTPGGCPYCEDVKCEDDTG
jgi:hypothetical protein